MKLRIKASSMKAHHLLKKQAIVQIIQGYIEIHYIYIYELNQESQLLYQ